MTKTTRMLTAGLVAMVGMGATRPAVAQDLSVTVPVQNRAHVADDVVVAIGFPSVDRATEGTIRAARKYHAPQITAADVVLGDVSAPQFLQSDAFARLLKDPDVAAALRPYGVGGCNACMK